MSATPTGRLGDGLSHGAVLITGSPNRIVNDIPVCRLGDLINCPIEGHGINPIIAINTQVFTNGEATTNFTAISQCGAQLISGSPNVFTG